MRHEKLIKNPDGSRHKIMVSFHTFTGYNDKFEYRVFVQKCDAGKRTFNYIPYNLYDHEYRAMSLKERAEYDTRRIIEEIGEDNLQAAKLELWQKMKP